MNRRVAKKIRKQMLFYNQIKLLKYSSRTLQSAWPVEMQSAMKGERWATIPSNYKWVVK